MGCATWRGGRGQGGIIMDVHGVLSLGIIQVCGIFPDEFPNRVSFLTPSCVMGLLIPGIYIGYVCVRLG